MIRLTKHAIEAAERRGIAQRWIENTLRSPTRVMPDPTDPSLMRSFAPVPECGGRILRVVHRMDGDDILIITAHFDRGAQP